MTERIQLALYWDVEQWAIEAEDLDMDGNYDSSEYAIANPDSPLLNSLDKRCTYEAWGERTGRSSVRLIEIVDVIGIDDNDSGDVRHTEIP